MPKEKEKVKLKIVVVDDSDFSRKSIVEVLESHNYNVVGQASNAEEGVQISGTSEANLFIIDVVMPERSGIEMAKILLEGGIDAKLILMSSLNMEQIIIESISNGATDFLPKPFSPLDLLKAVEKVEIELNKA